MTAHHDTPEPRQNGAAGTDSPSMGRDPLLTEAQAVIGRGLLMLLRDPDAASMTLAELRSHLLFIEDLPHPDGERFIPMHELARELLTDP